MKQSEADRRNANMKETKLANHDMYSMTQLIISLFDVRVTTH